MTMQIGFWAMLASIVGYQTALLPDRGFSNEEAGLMTSVRCLAGIACQPLLGGFVDRHPEFPPKRIVPLSMLLSLGVSVWCWLAPGMGLGETALVWAVIGGLEMSSYLPMDAMAIQFINDGAPICYSLGRGLGSLVYVLTCMSLGFQVERSGVESTLLTHVMLVAAEIALVAIHPPYRDRPCTRDAEGSKSQSALALLQSNPSFTLMLAGVLLSLTAVLPPSNSLVNVVTNQGGTDADLDLTMSMTEVFELPTAFLFPKLLRRFGSGRLLLISAVFGTLEAVALLYTFNHADALLAQPLQLLGYGLLTPASVYFVNESVPEADRVRGQTVMMVASNGMGGMLGGLLAGWTLGMGGTNWVLAACAACGCAGAALCWAALRCPARRTV